MSPKIFFEDNLHYINMLLKTHSQGIKHNIDTGLFLDHTIESMEFFDTTLTSIHKMLENSNNYIDKNKVYFDILRSRQIFRNFIRELSNNTSPLSSELAARHKKIEKHLRNTDEAIDDIRAILKSESTELEESNDMISSKEMQMLLVDPEKETD